MAAFWVFLTVLLASTFDEYDAFSRWLGGATYAAVGTAVVLIVVVGLATWVNWRHARQRLRPGTVWEMAATDDSLTMSGPLIVRLTIPYQALATVRVVGEWVLMQQLGAPTMTVWPRELFTDDTLARMTTAAG